MKKKKNAKNSEILKYVIDERLFVTFSEKRY